MRTKKVAVTGGCGFMGSHLVHELKKLNYNVKVIDLKKHHDLTDYSTWREVDGLDAVFHLATLPLPLSLVCPYTVSKEIFIMGLNLCEMARKGHFKTLIQVSSSEVYGSAEYTPMDEKHPNRVCTPYAAAKCSADKLLLSYINTFKIDAVIVRPFNNYGERQPIGFGGVIPATINRILKGEKPVIYGDGRQMRDFIYVKDTVRGIRMAYECEKAHSQEINLSGTPVEIYEIVKGICNLMGYHGKIKYIKQRVADVDVHVGDGSKALDLLGFQPEVTLEDGLERTIRWYSSHTS